MGRAGTAGRRLAAAMLCCAFAAGLVATTGAGAAEPSVPLGGSLLRGPVQPAQWPSVELASPAVEGWPNALRVWGPDRHQMTLASSLVLRGKGNFPFDSPDPSGGFPNSLAAADHWWGLGVCPKSVTIVAGDSQADALAAAALTDPTDRSSEPYLMRVAAADPLFDPPGGFARVDTYGAPMLVTDSVRSGARKLALSVRLAVQDLRLGGCKSVRQAIIVGGPEAVAVEVEAELVSIGIAEVFRVAGDNRYGTAAAVAHALGTAAAPASASDCVPARNGADNADGIGGGVSGDSSSDSDSGGDDIVEPSRRPPPISFWANSVVEWRESPTDCELLGRTVVLADGIDGIDALAAGWWTSYWQVPVLLGDGSNRLPAETAAAMTLLNIDNIIVVGGTARLSDEVMDEAARLTGAQVRRVGGPNRYATSVEMAKHLGGWWPGADPDDGGFESAVVCIAASGGQRRAARGLEAPNALGVGAWCGTAAAAGAEPPPRILGAVTSARPPSVPASADRFTQRSGSPNGSTTNGLSKSEQVAVPLILVPGSSDELIPSVKAYLEAVFAAPADCAAAAGSGTRGSGSDAISYTAALEAGTCPEPGFAVAFGGPETITPDMLGQISSIVSGGLTSAVVPEIGLAGAETPDAQSPFGLSSVRGLPLGVGTYATTLSMTPLFHTGKLDSLSVTGPSTTAQGAVGSAAPVSICFPRGTYPNARWLQVEAPQAGRSVTTSLGQIDLTNTGWYRRDHDGQFRSVGEGAPGCLEMELPAELPVLLRAVDPLGRSSATLLVASDVSRRFGVTEALVARDPQITGLRSEEQVLPGVTQWVFTSDAPASQAEIGDAAEPIVMSRIQIDLRRRDGTGGTLGTTTFRAEWFIRTPKGRAAGTADGEAVLRAGKWWLRGASVLVGGNWASSILGLPGEALPDVRDPASSSPNGASKAPLRIGTSDGYGAGGFSAEITLNGSGSSDDMISWQPEAFINTAPN